MGGGRGRSAQDAGATRAPRTILLHTSTAVTDRCKVRCAGGWARLTSVVLAAAAGAPAHLDVLATGNPPGGGWVLVAVFSDWISSAWLLPCGPGRLHSAQGVLAPVGSAPWGAHLNCAPSYLRARVKATVLAGMLRPVEKVSVAKSTWWRGGRQGWG